MRLSPGSKTGGERGRPLGAVQIGMGNSGCGGWFACQRHLVRAERRDRHDQQELLRRRRVIGDVFCGFFRLIEMDRAVDFMVVLLLFGVRQRMGRFFACEILNASNLQGKALQRQAEQQQDAEKFAHGKVG